MCGRFSQGEPSRHVSDYFGAFPDDELLDGLYNVPPTETIDDDGLTSFDIGTDGIDFWESLEGMRVTVDSPIVVSNSNEFGETDIVASLGIGATGVNAQTCLPP